jgi:hypothetical protein
MPYKNIKIQNEYQRKYQHQVRLKKKMSKEFAKTLKQILLFIGVSYTARGIESTADIPAEEIDEIHKSLISALTREQQAFMEENASEISAELGVLFRFNHFLTF